MAGTVSGVGTPQHRLTDLELDFVSLVPAGDNGPARVLITKSAVSEPEEGKHMGTKPEIDKAALPDDVVEYIAALEDHFDKADEVEKGLRAEVATKDAEIVSLNTTITKMVPKDAQSDDEIQKEALAKADPAVRSLIEKVQKDLKDAQEIAKAERDARLTKEYISKAEELTLVGGEDRAAFATLLRAIAESLTPEQTAEVEKAFADANARIAKSDLFKSYGSDRVDDGVKADVEKVAAEIRKAHPDLTPEQATVKAYEENPDLFAQAMTEKDN